MYCENCGHKQESSDKFCTSCGISVHSEKINHKAPSSKPEEKWWYRLLKVFFILIYVCSIGIICAIFFSEMPRPTLDVDLSRIQCNSGKTYAPGKNNIYLNSETLDSSDDEKARILCAYDTTNYYSSTYPAPLYKNYTFYPYFTRPDYISWLFYFLLGLFFTLVILKLIRLGVQYVAFGSKPIWSKEFKKMY